MKLRFSALLLFLLTLPRLHAADGQQVVSFTASGASTVSVKTSGTGINFYSIQWNISGGTLSGCTVALDSSTDGVSWSAGGAIAGQTCTSNGISAITQGTFNFIRINVTTFTINTGTPTLTVTWIGSASNAIGTNGSNNISAGIAACNTTTLAANGGQSDACYGHAAGNALTSGNSNTFVGDTAGVLVSTGSSNTCVGSGTCNSIVGTVNNTAVGQAALNHATTNDSTAIGQAALASSTCAGSCGLTAVGKDSQQGGLTGQFNTSIGQDSLLGINGASTCASGADTNWTGNNNTGLGYGAGCNISGSAADNTFAGFESFGATTAVFTGSGNTGMGSNSGRTCVSCANDTFIGFNADASASGRANSIAIGNGASATADNFAYFGNASVTGFKIGVGFGLSKPSSVVLCGNGTNGDGSCIFQAAQVQASANVGMFDPFMAFSSSGVAAWTNGANYTGTRDVGLSRTAAGVLSVGNGTASDVTGTIKAGAYNTGTNCSSSAAPAVCGSACAGSVVVAAGATTVTVNTTCTTASSQIFIQPDASLNTKLSVTCNTTGTLLDAEAWVSARTGGTSFVITVNAAPSVNPECFSYFIVN